MLLKMELKKIWNIRILILLAAMGLLFGLLFLLFPLKHFPNGHPAQEQYQLMLDWSKQYGSQLDEAEFADAAARLKTKLGMADADVNLETLMDRAYGGDTYLQQWAGALYAYEIRNEELRTVLEAPEYYTPSQRERAAYVIKADKCRGIIPYEAPNQAAEYWKWVSVFITLSVMLLLAPVITKDVLTDVRRLQYTSRRGRNIIKAQLAAMLLSAAGILLLELLIFGLLFGSLYGRLDTWQFLNSPVNSFFYGPFYWFDMNFGQYLLCMLFFILLMTAGSAGMAFFLSCFSRNYISLMLKLIPLFTLLAAISIFALTYPFSFDNLMSALTGIRGMELYAAAAVFLAGSILSLIALKCKSVVSDKDAAA